MKTLTPQILGMYIGCKCNVTASEYYEEMKGATLQGLCIEDSSARIVPNGDVSLYEVDFADVTLILRQWSGMQREDVEELILITGDNANSDEIDFAVKDFRENGVTNFLSGDIDGEDFAKIVSVINMFRRRGFDCDNLIPSGLALDSTTLK